MSHDVYYQFHSRPGQPRRAGARGGKATARNRREHLDIAAAELAEAEAWPAPQFSLETTVRISTSAHSTPLTGQSLRIAKKRSGPKSLRLAGRTSS